jgi:hypothetical protein
MKYAIWLVPVVLVGLAPSVIEEGASWLDTGAVALILCGAISA